MWFQTDFFRLCLVSRKFEGKHEGKKIVKKKKVKENKNKFKFNKLFLYISLKDRKSVV